MCMQQCMFTSVTNARSNLHLCSCVIFLKEITEKRTECKRKSPPIEEKGRICKHQELCRSRYILTVVLNVWKAASNNDLVLAVDWPDQWTQDTHLLLIIIRYPSFFVKLRREISSWKRLVKNSCMRTQKSTKAEKLNKLLHSYSRKNGIKQMT